MRMYFWLREQTQASFFRSNGLFLIRLGDSPYTCIDRYFLSGRRPARMLTMPNCWFGHWSQRILYCPADRVSLNCPLRSVGWRYVVVWVLPSRRIGSRYALYSLSLSAAFRRQGSVGHSGRMITVPSQMPVSIADGGPDWQAISPSSIGRMHFMAFIIFTIDSNSVQRVGSLSWSSYIYELNSVCWLAGVCLSIPFVLITV